jgi:arylsulfatase A-like enzyme
MIHRRMFLLQTLGTLSAMAVAPGTWAATVAKGGRPPNFLFIMADDLGFADLGAYGAVSWTTPHLDALAGQGMRFTQAYANSCLCSPTRVALITGRYQYRLPVGLEEPLHYKQAVADLPGLSPETPTLPALLKGQGYRTALIGKWHLGYAPDYGPLKSGYDYFYGFYSGGVNYFTYKDAFGGHDVFDMDDPVEGGVYLTDALTDKAVSTLEAYAKTPDRPFLLSLHHAAPHWPWQGPDDRDAVMSNLMHVDGGGLGTYASMVQSLDQSVGKVMAALDRLGLADNTVVIFTSDNGGERFSQTWPLSGEKGSLLEGGIRVPLVVRWPGLTKPGSTSDQVTITMDWTRTMLAAANVDLSGLGLDGMDMRPSLAGGAAVSRTLYWRLHGNDQAAVRQGDWKYLKIGNHEYLFNLAADPRERGNLAQRQAATFASLKAAYAEWNATMLPIPEGHKGYALPVGIFANVP